MKSALALSILFAAPLALSAADYASDQLLPAGSLIQCTTSEPRLSSKTLAVGDPVMCRVSHAVHVGRSVLPYNSYLVGRFEDYRDPGHFVGKGWMQLTFDRIVIEPDTIIPLDAKVVDVPGFAIDRQGRIQGKGHATRDTVLWMIPVLWPIDLLELPRRGPSPTLKTETRMTVKLMDDLRVPEGDPLERDPYGLAHRPSAKYEPPPRPAEREPEPQPMASAPQQQYPQQQYYPQQQQAYASPQPAYANYPPPQPVYTPPPVYIVQQPVYVAPTPVFAYPAPAYAVAAPPPVYSYMYPPAAPSVITPPAVWSPTRSAVVYRNGMAYQMYIP
jgi:hypothetical protein